MAPACVVDHSMLQAKHVSAAAAVMLMFVWYLGPLEALGVREGDLVEPSLVHPHFTINLHPEERRQTSKTGLKNETVMLDSSTIPFLGQALAALRTGPAMANLMQLEYHTLRNQWQEALRSKLCGALPAQALGPLSRSPASTSQPHRDEEARMIGVRQVGEALWGSCRSESGVAPTAHSGPEDCHESRRLFQAGSPKTFRKKRFTTDKWVIELFSCTAHLSQAMADMGFNASVLSSIFKFVAKHNVVLLWMGMPCQSWSRARRLDGGPPSLRDDGLTLFGYGDLGATDKSKVSQANQLLEVTVCISARLYKLCIPWVIENPWTSLAHTSDARLDASRSKIAAGGLLPVHDALAQKHRPSMFTFFSH